MQDIDYVITYVDGSDPVWQKEYEEATGKKIDVKKSERFRSWDNLKYNLRAVEKNLPFVRKVHLVVSGPSQVPGWVNTDNVNVVYHKDIIPEKFLPVFCSTSIEMFLGFIPGLANCFIYANDDMFTGKKCVPEDFFVDGKPVLNYRDMASFTPHGQYQIQLQNSFKLARRVSGNDNRRLVMSMPPHTLNSMTVNSYKKVWAAAGSDIEEEITMLRKDSNYNQYLFSYYDLLIGNYTRNNKNTTSYLEFGGRGVSALCNEIEHMGAKTFCLNDAGVRDFEKFKTKIKETFNKLYPMNSKYDRIDNPRRDKPLVVHLYTLCYNEMRIAPFAVDYWKTVADKIFVLDNGSTDGSIEYLKKIPNVSVIPFSDGTGFNDDTNMRIKNHVWKASRGKADFVIVTDFDEFMYAKDLRAELQGMKDRDETICKPRGYNIYSEEFPEYEEGKLCHELCGKAIADKMFCKVTIFNPNEIKEMRYTPGAHECKPKGNVRWYSGDKIFLFHHKNLGLDYVLKRYEELRKRLSAKNKIRQWGEHYSAGTKKITEEFNNKLAKCVDVNDLINEE